MNEIDRGQIVEIPCAYCGKTCFMHVESLHVQGKARAFCDGNCADNWANQWVCGTDTEAKHMEEMDGKRPLLKDASEVTGIWDLTGGVAPVDYIRGMRDAE